jgi:hypothetical protein
MALLAGLRERLSDDDLWRDKFQGEISTSSAQKMQSEFLAFGYLGMAEFFWEKYFIEISSSEIRVLLLLRFDVDRLVHS